MRLREYSFKNEYFMPKNTSDVVKLVVIRMRIDSIVPENPCVGAEGLAKCPW